MAIELARNVPAPAANTTKRGDAAPQEAAELYGNIGYTSVNEETGEETFVSLPIGLALDTMRPKAYGTTEAYNQLMQSKNMLLQDLLALAKDLKPGESDIVVGLQIQIHRVKTKVEPNADTNSLRNNPTGLRLASKAA